MKVAVPTVGNKGLDEVIGEHFGRVPTYTIVDSDTKEFKVIENASHHMGGQGLPPELLEKEGVEVMLCTSLGRRAIMLFKEKGIKVYAGAFGTVSDALESWRAGELQEVDEGGACSQHAFRGSMQEAGLCSKEHDHD